MNTELDRVTEHMLRVLGLYGYRNNPPRDLDPRHVDEHFYMAHISYHRFGGSNVILPYIYLEIAP